MPEDEKQAGAWRGVLLALSVASAVFTLAVVIVLTANLLAAQAVDPLNPPGITELRELLRDQPQNEQLRETIRDIDQQYRQQFFIHQSLRTQGVRLALGGALVFLTSLHLLTRKRPAKQSLAGTLKSEETQRSEQRRSLLLSLGTAGAILAVLAVLPMNLSPQPPPPCEGIRGGAPPPERAQNAAGSGGDQPGADGALPTATVHWPGFRGPNGLGIAETSQPPMQWDGKSGQQIAWKTEIPRPGYSSPIVVGDAVYLTGGDKVKREIYCFDSASGEIRWRADTQGIPDSPEELPSVTEDTGYAAPSMTSDGARVFAIFATGNILALDLAGNRLWARNLGVPENHYGHSSSLLMVDGKLIVQFDHFGGSRVLALAPGTGETLWETLRFEVGISWSSPAYIPAGEQGQIILCGDPSVAAYAPRDGSLLWSSDILSGEIGASPAYADGVVFEGNEFALMAALQALPTPEHEQGELLWEVSENLPNVSSPVVVGKRLYMADSYATVSCLDISDGSTVWTRELEAGFYASPIVAAGNIYLTDMKGVTTILAPGDSFRPLHSNALGESVVTSPAFADKRLYLRGRKHLYAIGE